MSYLEHLPFVTGNDVYQGGEEPYAKEAETHAVYFKLMSEHHAFAWLEALLDQVHFTGARAKVPPGKKQTPVQDRLERRAELARTATSPIKEEWLESQLPEELRAATFESLKSTTEESDKQTFTRRDVEWLYQMKCHCFGKHQNRQSEDPNKKRRTSREHMSVKCGCLAEFSMKKRKNTEGIFVQFQFLHNHQFTDRDYINKARLHAQGIAETSSRLSEGKSVSVLTKELKTEGDRSRLSRVTYAMLKNRRGMQDQHTKILALDSGLHMGSPHDGHHPQLHLQPHGGATQHAAHPHHQPLASPHQPHGAHPDDAVQQDLSMLAPAEVAALQQSVAEVNGEEDDDEAQQDIQIQAVTMTQGFQDELNGIWAGVRDSELNARRVIEQRHVISQKIDELRKIVLG
ncbi:hypothetical protein TRVA0_012S02300 [Trichomonascus vanleenenianus]|uniref:uncharacterized protein n=1 Tax=Trichomonascus vanleenenianus TaxID=2268995 RepID=UPI003EC9A133